MKTALFAYSRQGCQTAKRIREALGEGTIYTPEKYMEPGFLPTEQPGKSFYGKLFQECDALIFVSSCGIAVRQIAPHVNDKCTDPAVLCIDELGRFVIALLCGHIGGANALACSVAQALEGTAVITTATDIHGRFSPDTWAAQNGCVIDSRKVAKAISAAILERDIPLYSAFPVTTAYPAGICPGSRGALGIAVTYGAESPFDTTLRLIPRVLHLGIGCRRGIGKEAVQEAVEQAFADNGLDLRGVKCAASIDLKAKEPGLLDYCREQGFPIRFYSPEELMQAEGAFTASEFVRQTTGADNVCERSALLGADTLIVRKTAKNGVTVAVAAEKWEVRFG